jgi:hypothetical protein
VRLGRGKGTTTRWPEDTAERAQLIARTLEDGDPRLSRAARVLIAAGYSIGGKALRPLIEAEIKAIDAELTRRQHNVPATTERKRRNKARSVRRKLVGLPASITDAIVDVIVAACGLIPGPRQNACQETGHYVSPALMRRALDETTDAELAEILMIATPKVRPAMLLMLGLLGGAMLGAVLYSGAHAGTDDAPQRDADPLPPLILPTPDALQSPEYRQGLAQARTQEDEVVSTLTVAMTLWYVMARRHGDKMMEAIHGLVDQVFGTYIAQMEAEVAHVDEGGGNDADSPVVASQ